MKNFLEILANVGKIETLMKNFLEILATKMFFDNRLCFS